MVKKMYSAPVVKSDDVVLGVFGCYNQKPGTPASKSSKRRSFGRWWGWFGFW